MSIHRTPAGAGLILVTAMLVVMLALHVTADGRELPNGMVKESHK